MQTEVPNQEGASSPSRFRRISHNSEVVPHIGSLKSASSYLSTAEEED